MFINWNRLSITENPTGLETTTAALVTEKCELFLRPHSIEKNNILANSLHIRRLSKTRIAPVVEKIYSCPYCGCEKALGPNCTAKREASDSEVPEIKMMVKRTKKPSEILRSKTQSARTHHITPRCLTMKIPISPRSPRKDGLSPKANFKKSKSVGGPPHPILELLMQEKGMTGKSFSQKALESIKSESPRVKKSTCVLYQLSVESKATKA